MARKAAGKHSRNKSASSQAQPKSPASSFGKSLAGTNGSNDSSSSRRPMPLPVSSDGRQGPANSVPGKFRLFFLLFPLLQMLWQLEAPLRPFSVLRDPETGEILRRRVRVPDGVDASTNAPKDQANAGSEAREAWKEEPILIEPRILVVVPHVRDLGLFAPTLEVMLEGRRRKQSELFVLGLSIPPSPSVQRSSAEAEPGTGSWDRRFEWTSALEVFGLLTERVLLLDAPVLQDDPKALWEPDVVEDKVLPYVLKLDIDTILTFDERGITGNPQHSAVSQGIVSLVRSDRLRDALSPNSTSASASASVKPSKSFKFFKSSSSHQEKEKETAREPSIQTPSNERIYPRAFFLQSPSAPLVNLGPLSPITQHITLAYNAIFSKKTKSKTDPELGLSKAERRTTFVTDIRHYTRGWRALAKISGETGLVDGKALKWALERSLWVNEWVEA